MLGTCKLSGIPYAREVKPMPLPGLKIDSPDQVSALVLETLRKAIVDLSLPPGKRLVEREIAREMGVSRTPVREALRHLELQGLVEHLPRKGCVVRDIDPEELEEIFSIREALEILAMRECTRRGDLRVLEDARRTIDRGFQALEENDVEGIHRSISTFNDVLVAACGMPRLIGLIRTYLDFVERYRRILVLSETRPAEILEEHADILRAVEEGNPERVEELVHDHLANARTSFHRLWEERKMKIGEGVNP